ncbi:MAG: hypothetical protein M3R50_00465 [Bacteroidota bacterium]|nr:hypothetical protein [Bacteroidota bacterium]
MHEEEGFSIWLFVGIMLAIYGPIVLIANIPGLSTSQNQHVVLERLHAGIWWGILLTLIGALFLYLHWPGKEPCVLDEKDNNILFDNTEQEN